MRESWTTHFETLLLPMRNLGFVNSSDDTTMTKNFLRKFTQHKVKNHLKINTGVKREFNINVISLILHDWSWTIQEISTKGSNIDNFTVSSTTAGISAVTQLGLEPNARIPFYPTKPLSTALIEVSSSLFSLTFKEQIAYKIR